MAMNRKLILWGLAAVAACPLALLEPAWAAPSSGGGGDGADLRRLQADIQRAERALGEKRRLGTAAKAEAAESGDELRKSRAELKRIQDDKEKTLAKLKGMQEENLQMETKLNGRKANVARMLNARYQNQKPDALILMLQNKNPNEKYRQLEYMSYINDANKSVMSSLRNQKDELDQRVGLAKEQSAKLTELYDNQVKIINALSQKNRVALRKQYNLESDISSQLKQLESLRANERRLRGVLQDISVKEANMRREAQSVAASGALAAPSAQSSLAPSVASNASAPASPSAAAAEAPARVAQPVIVDASKAVPAAPASPASPSAPPAAESASSSGGSAPAADGASAPAPLPAGSISVSDFGRLQGRMPRPIAGGVAHRFGSKRSTGGIWQGVYLSGSEQPVRAVAPGKVAYAGYLKGYGDMVILLHNTSYITIYSGLSRIDVTQNRRVEAGQTLGASGADRDFAGESGLYFALRYQNKALNPANWIR